MAKHDTRLKTELIDKVAVQVRAKLTKGQAPAVEAFLRQFYAHVPPDDIVDTDPDDLYGAALTFWKFGQSRPPEEPLVRVYNPRHEEHGWKSVHTVVEIIQDNMPFLVDSVTAELNRRGLAVHLVIHPVVRVRRDAEGRFLELLDPAAGSNGAATESFMHVEIDEQSSGEPLRDIADGLERVLADVRRSVTDWPTMRTRVDETIAALETDAPPLPADEVEEGREFLHWLCDDHFTFLGYREYETVGEGAAARMTVVPDTGLGVLHDPALHVFEGVRALNDLPDEVREYLHRKQLLIINKSNMLSTVHRGVHMDAIGIKRFDASGNVVGERLFVGLFTSTVYYRSPRYIPVLRRKISDTVQLAGFEPSGHNAKALLHILETYPRDELFQIDEEELCAIGVGILHLQERQRIALFVRHDAFQRFVSCVVYVPRDRFSTDLRRRFQAILETVFEGEMTSFSTQLADESVLGRIQFNIKTTPGAVPDYSVPEVEAQLVEAGRSWADKLRDALVDGRGEENGLRLLRRYGRAFPTAYREDFGAATALVDLDRIEEAIETGILGLHLYRPLEAPEDEVRFKIYNLGDPVPLSDVLPMLEHMGLMVIDEVPFEVVPEGAGRVWIHDFGMVRRDGGGIDIGEVRGAFHDAFARVWSGEMEDDGFNRLVIGAGLDWRAVVVVRAYAKYLRQAAIPFSQAYMEETLARNPGLAQCIVRLFATRFDPAASTEDGGAKLEQKLLGQIEAGLEEVANLDEDRIIRRFANLVNATLRTNFYQPGEDGAPKPYLSFKLDSQVVDDLPLPRPMVEIFVYSPRTEGVHLRGGKVARGGIRWSDRREDFRTEILGLMKAQMVKNAVIVPVGSNGGFVVKRPPAPTGDAAADREALGAEGVACYRTLMCGLLDLTDNLKGSDVIPPPDVVRKDGDDPYLVVAADKGTAAFSDIANGISQDYGFWLDDAFASGGSAGYDHKKMGITARGGWEAVKRHFRELGHDIQTQDFTVIGIGDMGGDVFGNGMLLSGHIRLVAAFNHLHIFVDPDPDAAASFEERKRLFTARRGGWDQYDAKLISKGGGVFERKAKSIAISPEIKALLGISRDKLTPNALIRAILTAKADLMWFGGIGSYVKARDESDADADDRANDALRVDARGLNVRVVGEGANLGMTQRGRIEFARAGGRINTDAIDNSAGVDASDHEVNIKVLLGDVVAAGDMTTKQRNTLLARMTDEVGALVLRDNYLQTQAISLIERRSARLLDPQMRLMRALEKADLLNRAIEFLPDDEELAERMADKEGLSRPEIAVLFAYSKITLYDRLLESDLPDDPVLVADLERYFPAPLQKKYKAQIAGHRLRREIIATFTTNSMVNRVGGTFVHDIQDKTGAAESDIARAYIVTRDSFELRKIWIAVEALDNAAPAELQAEMLLETVRLIERCTLWFLRNGRLPLDIAANIGQFGPGIAALDACLEDLITETDCAALSARAAALVERGAPKDLAARVARLDILVCACDIVRLASGDDMAVEDVGRIYFSVGDRFGIDWLREAADGLGADGHWDQLAITAIVDDLYAHQFDLTRKILEAAGGATEAVEGVIEAWVDTRQAMIERTQQLLDDLKAAPTIDLAMLAVANRQLRALVAG
jgi:glutamate dehydrogenase